MTTSRFEEAYEHEAPLANKNAFDMATSRNRMESIQMTLLVSFCIQCDDCHGRRHEKQLVAVGTLGLRLQPMCYDWPNTTSHKYKMRYKQFLGKPRMNGCSSINFKL